MTITHACTCACCMWKFQQSSRSPALRRTLLQGKQQRETTIPMRLGKGVTVRECMNHGKLMIWKANNLRSRGWVEVVTRSANTRLAHQISRSARYNGVIDAYHRFAPAVSVVYPTYNIWGLMGRGQAPIPGAQTLTTTPHLPALHSVWQGLGDVSTCAWLLWNEMWTWNLYTPNSFFFFFFYSVSLCRSFLFITCIYFVAFPSPSLLCVGILLS